MFEKLSAFFKVLRVGNEVVDPDKWMKRQADGNKVGLLILALIGLAKAYGYDLPMSDDDALILGGALVSIWNIVLTTVSSSRTGLLPAKPDAENRPTVSTEASATVQPKPPVTQPDPKAEVQHKVSTDKKVDTSDPNSIYFGGD